MRKCVADISQLQKRHWRQQVTLRKCITDVLFKLILQR